MNESTDNNKKELTEAEFRFFQLEIQKKDLELKERQFKRDRLDTYIKSIIVALLSVFGIMVGATMKGYYDYQHQILLNNPIHDTSRQGSSNNKSETSDTINSNSESTKVDFSGEESPSLNPFKQSTKATDHATELKKKN